MVAPLPGSTTRRSLIVALLSPPVFRLLTWISEPLLLHSIHQAVTLFVVCCRAVSATVQSRPKRFYTESPTPLHARCFLCHVMGPLTFGRFPAPCPLLEIAFSCMPGILITLSGPQPTTHRIGHVFRLSSSIAHIPSPPTSYQSFRTLWFHRDPASLVK